MRRGDPDKRGQASCVFCCSDLIACMAENPLSGQALACLGHLLGWGSLYTAESSHTGRRHSRERGNGIPFRFSDTIQVLY